MPYQGFNIDYIDGLFYWAFNCDGFRTRREAEYDIDAWLDQQEQYLAVEERYERREYA